ncbi:hypothetical protein [Streptomyces sp. NPDC055107]
MTITTATDITLHPLPDDWTPPADWERASLPVGSEDPGGERKLTGYEASIAFVLDTERRELSVHFLVHRGTDSDGAPGDYVTHEHITNGVAPPRILLGGLNLNTSVDLARPERINALLQEVRPLAQEIADNLLPVAGTTGRDWTARAADAQRAAAHLLERYPYRSTEYDFAYRRPWYLIDADVALKVLPDLINPAWADATDQQLQDAAATLETQLRNRCQTNTETLERLILISLTGTRLPDTDDGRPSTHIRLHGARAWLHAYRRDQAAGLTPMDTARWDGTAHHALHITDDCTDADLAAVARQAERDAAAQGVKLLAADRWARPLRADRRAAIRTQLSVLRDQIGELEDKIKPARKRRTVLVTRVLGWGEEDTDSGLGRSSGLSHTAVGTIRASLDTTEETNQ